MRNKWKRKSLATLLALCMVFTMTPAAFAAETDDNSSAVDSAEVKTSTVEVSDENGLLSAIKNASGETVIALTADISTTELISIAEGKTLRWILMGMILRSLLRMPTRMASKYLVLSRFWIVLPLSNLQ